MMNTSAGLNNNASTQQRKTNQNIQVYVRVRPLNARERYIRSSEVIEVVSPKEIVTRHALESKLTKKFTFDRAFGPESKQVDVYSTVVAPLIEEVLSGYNCTVFAYGQTGTGKTYTMVGTECAELKSSWEDDSEIGIIPRALSHLFDELRLMEVEFMMRISYLELYNEELCDLLSSDDSTKIRIFDDSTKKGSVIIQGLEEIPVHSKDDVYKLLEKGKERRKTAQTLMNAQSSRSHTVFSIVVHIRENGLEGEELVKIGKLNLVDLAGSENVSKAGNEKGIRVRETVNINQSLLTLGRVITALVERTPHIPYRESKLTRLLQESLGGRTKTSIIATISPGHKDIEETLSTLEYAHRAKNIQNKPEVNQKLNKRTILKEYSDEIDKLKRDLAAARDKNGVYLAEETYSELTLKMDSQTRELNEKMLLLKALKDEMANKERMFNEVSVNLVDRTEKLKLTDEKLIQTIGTLQQTKKTLDTTKRRYKEKKFLLNTHVKTEQVLRDQATQILQVADTATKDTEQLHSTIERRKYVEQKIQTACERFVARMQDNFELLDDNLNTYQDKQKDHAQLLFDEFVNSTNIAKRLMKNSNEKILAIQQICTESAKQQDDLSEQFLKKLNNLSDEHRSALTDLYNQLRTKETKLQAQIVSNLTDVENFNEQQKHNFETMRHSIRQQLEQSTNDMVQHSQAIQAQIKNLKVVSETNLSDLTKLNAQIALERQIVSKEQSVIDDFLKKMHEFQQQRGILTENMNTNTTNLESNCKKSLQLLRESDETTAEFNQKHCDNTRKIIEDIHTKIHSSELEIDKCDSKCATMRTQLTSLHHECCEQLNKCQHTANAHCADVKEQAETYATNLKRKRENDLVQMKLAKTDMEYIIGSEAEKLKIHAAVGNSFTTELQLQTKSYVQDHMNGIQLCVRDLSSFQESELETYVPTGETPSKREFVYPRILASTSPHMQIVKRFRQENDWSDLDTTATIDEGSEGEEERNSAQELSDAETLFNSTPIDSPSGKERKRSSATKKQTLAAKVAMRSSNGLSTTKSPNKSSPRYLSPVLKENKENTV